MFFFFQCVLCSKFSLKNWRHHCKSQHEMKTVPFNLKNVTEARYHRCHICCIIVMCDLEVIRNHVAHMHKVIIGQYKKDFVMKGGWKVFPTFWDYQQDNDVFESLESFKTDKPRVDLDLNDSDKIMPWMLSSESEDSDET